MAEANGPTAQICQWVGGTRYEDIPEEVRRETVTLLYDQLGGMIASAPLPSCRPVADLAARLGGAGQCSIVGLPLRTTITNAALANGSIAHGDEVDSTGQQGTGHYAATTVPAAFSVAQHVGATGKEFMRALTLGSEVAARFQSVLGRYGTRNQFAASVGGTMGATVSSGLLLGLNEDEMENALGLAASGACGLSSHHRDETHQIKSLNHGRAAEAAVVSALLAREGFHGPREIMTIENGFFDAFLGLPRAGHDVIEGLGEEYLMREVAYKRYPVGGPDQTPLYAFLQLMKSNELTADDIDQVEVSVSRTAYQTVKTNHHPSVHMETILTLAAVYGEITFNHIHDPSYLDDPRCQAFQERARIMIIPRAEPGSMAERLEMGITVRTGSGEVIRQNLRYPLMSEDEIQEKFRTLVGLRVSADRVLDLEQKLLAVEQAENVAPLFQQLEIEV
ncbi:MAG: MmgE/PrpD family protein [Chloroflexi bacterium]|nr:MmgE/PrpD family protein [Chloroflexota bacterium]